MAFLSQGLVWLAAGIGVALLFLVLFTRAKRQSSGSARRLHDGQSADGRAGKACPSPSEADDDGASIAAAIAAVFAHAGPDDEGAVAAALAALFAHDDHSDEEAVAVAIAAGAARAA